VGHMVGGKKMKQRPKRFDKRPQLNPVKYRRSTKRRKPTVVGKKRKNEVKKMQAEGSGVGRQWGTGEKEKNQAKTQTLIKTKGAVDKRERHKKKRDESQRWELWIRKKQRERGVHYDIYTVGTRPTKTSEL